MQRLQERPGRHAYLNHLKPTARRCGAVQCSAVQCGAVHRTVVQCSAAAAAVHCAVLSSSILQSDEALHVIQVVTGTDGREHR